MGVKLSKLGLFVQVSGCPFHVKILYREELYILSPGFGSRGTPKILSPVLNLNRLI